MKNIEHGEQNKMTGFDAFASKEQLTSDQADKFQRYLSLLIEWNQRVNLTAIDTQSEILAYHFQDSMRIADFVSLKSGQTVCDVGTGGGFPGIPLKILNPDLHVILLEVNQKKIQFLETVIKELELTNIEVCSLDWRTFLRKAPYESIDYMCARASLQPDELIRMFKPGCAYRQATLIYWASQYWHPDDSSSRYIIKQEEYTVGNKQRKYVFLKDILVEKE